jgi:hypothetical protein
MIRITSIEQALRNFAKTPINLSHKVDESQMQILCKKQFGWEVTYPNQKGDHEHALVVQPKIICLNPFLLITVPQDDFYEDLMYHQKIIVCICPETTYIDTLNDTFRISNQVYRSNDTYRSTNLLALWRAFYTEPKGVSRRSDSIL